jgi:hypothetical protein
MAAFLFFLLLWGQLGPGVLLDPAKEHNRVGCQQANTDAKQDAGY